MSYGIPAQQASPVDTFVVQTREHKQASQASMVVGASTKVVASSMVEVQCCV
jgi:hypothetical protein